MLKLLLTFNCSVMSKIKAFYTVSMNYLYKNIFQLQDFFTFLYLTNL